MPQPPRAGRLTPPFRPLPAKNAMAGGLRSTPSTLGEGRGGGCLGYRSGRSSLLDPDRRLGQRARCLLDGIRLGRRERQGEGENGALVGRTALDREASTVPLRQLAADEKAEPG